MQRTAVGLAAWLALTATPLGAQVPQGDLSELQNGLRVTQLQATDGPIVVTRGDTVVLTLPLLDARGQRVQGARIGITSSGSGDIDVRRVMDSIPDSYLMWGVEPGLVHISVVVQILGESGGFAWRDVGIQEVRVAEWPLARIDIAEPGFAPYAGTTFRLEGKAITDHDTEHFNARVTWRSEDPSVATISRDGVVALAQRGQVTVVAESEGIVARRTIKVIENPVRQIEIQPQFAETRTGDVIRFNIKALDERGRQVDGIALGYAVQGLDSAGAEIHGDGAFVAENPGAYKVLVTSGGLSADAVVQVVPREPATEVQLVAHAAVTDVTTSDLWVFQGADGRDYAYTGTHAEGGGNRVYVWDVTDPENTVLTDSVVVDGRVVNDVKVNGDASWAIITREGASSRRNGIVVLDLSDPSHPTIMSELTDSLTAGIHNVWINGDVVYAVNDGTSAMHILDLSDPRAPKQVGRWELRPGDRSKSLHDVWADGRYAYLSYWDDGLVILDIGAGTHGGTPTAPKFVSSIAYEMGNTHTAYREGDYVFVGDEIFGPYGYRGYVHVIDVSNLDQPAEVARFEVPEAGAHNIWVENGILYIAYYQGGLRIVDVSGELRGDLYRQGRQLAQYRTAAAEGAGIHPNAAMAWGPQLYKGNVFVSDMNSGLWIVKHQRPRQLSP